MATQDEAGLPFSISRNQQQFRLLELPPEVLQLIESTNPPQLSIKSQAPSVLSGIPITKSAHAVLCTADKTFQLRQVQTSNSVLVTQPTTETHGDDVPVPGVSAIASCTATLELHPSKESPLTYMKEVLPLYDIVDGLVDAPANGKSRERIFTNIPMSDGECYECWKQLIAFEFAGSSYRPSANTLAQVWKSINAGAVAEGIDLHKQFLSEEIIKTVDDDGHPMNLIVSMFCYLAIEGQESNGPWSCLDQSKTVPFVGKAILESKYDESNLLITDFLDSWKDNLPESWREDVKLDAIKDAYILPTTTTIKIKGEPESKKKAAGDTGPKTGPTRKWHEKFGRARR